MEIDVQGSQVPSQKGWLADVQQALRVSMPVSQAAKHESASPVRAAPGPCGGQFDAGLI
jgi:hypothetical protein